MYQNTSRNLVLDVSRKAEDFGFWINISCANRSVCHTFVKHCVNVGEDLNNWKNKSQELKKKKKEICACTPIHVKHSYILAILIRFWENGLINYELESKCVMKATILKTGCRTLDQAIRQLLSLWKLSDPRPVSMVNTVAERQCWLRLFRFRLVSIIPPIIHTHISFI
jgi:hypothetical protein